MPIAAQLTPLGMFWYGFFFTPDEINSAKNELYDECFDVLGVAPVHRDTARGAHVIAAKEIVDGIRKVDAAEVKVRPQFAAIKLDRLPQYGPEELDQPRARRGPRARSGPRPYFVRPARCS